jgi:DNA-binding NarL/FixJ family response regulator
MEVEEITGVKRSVVRVLVVDDVDLWQTFVHMRLDKDPSMHVIAVAADGNAAVQKTIDLQPDLVILDVGLPMLSGIEAARQIRNLVPRAEILFLSVNSDPIVVLAALDAGGRGYVLKSEAGRDLAAGIEAVLDGKRFVSPGLLD